MLDLRREGREKGERERERERECVCVCICCAPLRLAAGREITLSSVPADSMMMMMNKLRFLVSTQLSMPPTRTCLRTKSFGWEVRVRKGLLSPALQTVSLEGCVVVD